MKQIKDFDSHILEDHSKIKMEILINNNSSQWFVSTYLLKNYVLSPNKFWVTYVRRSGQSICALLDVQVYTLALDIIVLILGV